MEKNISTMVVYYVRSPRNETLKASEGCTLKVQYDSQFVSILEKNMTNEQLSLIRIIPASNLRYIICLHYV